MRLGLPASDIAALETRSEGWIAGLQMAALLLQDGKTAINSSRPLFVIPDGMHVASCVGFTDPANRAAEVEKVCTHNHYRRQGLAEAVIRECFHRLGQRGIDKAYIEGYSGEANGLYEKLDPCARKQWFHYELVA